MTNEGMAKTENQEMNQIDAVGKAAHLSQERPLEKATPKPARLKQAPKEQTNIEEGEPGKTERRHPEGVRGKQPLCENRESGRQESKDEVKRGTVRRVPILDEALAPQERGEHADGKRIGPTGHPNQNARAAGGPEKEKGCAQDWRDSESG
jgi:hypothetical protein